MSWVRLQDKGNPRLKHLAGVSRPTESVMVLGFRSRTEHNLVRDT